MTDPPTLKPIGHTILRLEEVPSTNTLLLENPEHLDNHGLVALARHQTEGRGRLGRSWASIPGAQLQFSLVVHPRLPPEEVPLYSLLSSLAVARGIERACGISTVLKWPNDVLAAGRKVCGILLEGRGSWQGKEPRLVIGFGINCNGRPGDFPPELSPVLTTLLQVGGRPVDMEALLQAILAEFQRLHERLAPGERAALLEEWTRRALLKGQRVRFHTQEGPREGVPLGLTAEGYLIVDTGNGERYVQISGELDWLASN